MEGMGSCPLKRRLNGCEMAKLAMFCDKNESFTYRTLLSIPLGFLHASETPAYLNEVKDSNGQLHRSFNLRPKEDGHTGRTGAS